jgi:hypothetical protein
VQMVFQHDVPVEFKVPILAQEFPGVEKDLNIFGTSKDGEPSDDGTGQEIGVFGFKDALTSARHAACYNAKRSFGKVVPKQEFGNEGTRENERTRERETEFREGRSQTGVWEREGKQEFGNEKGRGREHLVWPFRPVYAGCSQLINHGMPN